MVCHHFPYEKCNLGGILIPHVQTHALLLGMGLKQVSGPILWQKMQNDFHLHIYSILFT